MPIYQKDMADISKGADALSELILGNKHKQEQARLQQELDIQKAREDQSIRNAADQAQFQYAQAQAQQMGLRPGKYSINAGGVAINPQNDLSHLLQQQQLGERNDAQLRAETQALQNAHKAAAGYDPNQLAALSDVENLLSQNDKMAFGQLQTSLARLKDKGALSEGDVNRVLPRTIGRDVKGIAAYLGLGSGAQEDMLSPEEIASARQIIADKRGEIQNRISAADTEVLARSSTLAPSVVKAGKLDQIMKSLGGTAKAQISSPDLDAKKKRLEELRAKAGK